MNYQPIPKSKEEKERDFRDAFKRLKNSNELFDKDDYSETAGIAVEIYALIHDASSKQPSGLTLIGKNPKPIFINGAQPFTSGSGANLTTPLTGATLSTSGMKYFPLKKYGLGDNNKPNELDFNDWWNADVLRTEDGELFSRKMLVMHFRHVKAAHLGEKHTSQDGKPAEEFSKLSKGSALSD